MSPGLDTSVVVRLLTGEPIAQAEVARRLVATSPSPVAVSDLVVVESYFALRHHYAVPHGEALRALLALLGDPHVRCSGNARSVIAEAAAVRHTASQPGLVDRLIHADYRGDALDVFTFDRALARLPGAHVLE